MAPSENLDEAPNERDQPALRNHGRRDGLDTMSQFSTKSPLYAP